MSPIRRSPALTSTQVYLAGGSPSHANAWRVDWPRLARRALVIAAALVAAVTLYRNASGTQYGFDFHGGIWRAGQDLLAGRSPYAAANARQLLVTGNAFIPPPLLAVLAIPFSLLPFPAAVALWNVVCAGAFVAALRLLGVRDRRLWLLGLCSFPFLSSLILGQPDGLFALAAAAAWRYRDSWPGALAVGVLIAAKLLAWPLLLWLLVTRRIRCSLLAFFCAAALLVLSWTAIGFKGLLNYPNLLAADARAFQTRSHSVVAAAMRLGISEPLSAALAIAFAIVVGFAIVRASRRSDLGWFTAALAVGLLASPILWSHYLVLLFVPLAISRPRLDWVWMLAAAAFWISPVEPAHGWQIGLVLLAASTIAVMSGVPQAASDPEGSAGSAARASAAMSPLTSTPG